jgi:hypothetical protein
VRDAFLTLRDKDRHVAIFFTGNPYAGWTSLAGLLFVVGGFIGLYIGKIFDQVKERPLYVADRRIVRTPALERGDKPARGPILAERGREEADDDDA